MSERERLIELIDTPNKANKIRHGKALESEHPSEILADYLLENGVKVMEWISIKDRLPEKDGFYLAYAKSGSPFIPDVYVQEYVQEIGFTYDGDLRDDSITHWMPMPKPPKE